MSFPRYPSYKNSGVEWLGKVPEHWGIGQSRRLFALRNERAREDDKQLTASQEHGVIYQEDFIRLEGRRVVEVIKGADMLKHVEPNDFVISMRSFQGGIEWCNVRGCISSAYVMLVPCDRIHGPFFAYALKSRSYIQALQTTSNLVRDGQALRYENFTKVDLPLVPLDEQTAIAEFLDRETGKIDALVAEQRRLMELLKEKRQAVISHAVTRGLNPAAPLKPSGIEWLGDVPAHWIVTRVRYVAEVLDHQRVPVEVAERADRQGDYPYYGASGIIDTIDGYLFDEPVVLVCEDGWNLILRTQPVARPVSGKIWVNNHAHILRPKEGDSELLAAAIELAPFEAFVTGMRQPKLTLEMLKDIPVALPPDVAEQTAIRDFMQCAADKFDTLTAEAQRAIDLLLERRTALISAAVTGQIKVC